MQKICRALIEDNLSANAWENENSGSLPPGTFEKFAKAGSLIPSLRAPLPDDLLNASGIHELPGGVSLEQFD